MPPEADTSLIAERYLLKSQLGQGGMGIVWRADDELLKREVAVKEIRFPVELQEGESDKVGQRVLREARAAARLNHPGAVAVYDVMQGDHRAFIVMELCDAPTLDDIIKGDGPLDERRAAAIGLELLDTLESAHAQGIVHRDVKPANVMVPSDGPIKLADFGIASVRDDPRLTASGMILGSPAYMAPEQAHENPGTPATDLWSLGATLYTAVEGHAPFEKGSAIATLGAVLNEEPEFERCRNIRPAIQALLAKAPDDRPSLTEARAMLQGVAEGTARNSAASTVVAAPLPDTIAETQAATSPETRARETSDAVAPAPRPALHLPDNERSGNGWLVGLGVAALVGLLAWLAISALGGEDSGAPEKQRSERQNEDAAAGTAGEGSSEEEPEAPAEGEVAAPENWVTYTDEATGYEIAYPDGWEVVPVEGSATATDFRDPATGTYMRVEWTDEPGDDVIGRLEEIAASFSGEKAAYEEIRIEEVDFLDGWDAGEWEYVYEESGSTLHAINLQFVNGEYGFALNFQTRDQNWDVSQGIFEDFKESFVPPS
jgi:tRNA A-37 threonylcarbamoyl transferase component Bud32